VIAARVARMLRRWVSNDRRRRLSEAGYAAIMVALIVPTVGIACAAVAVDTGTWYVEMQMTQKAADAAALAGVPYLPQDFPNAKTRALAVAARNGFDNATNNTVTVEIGDKPTQLKVTISATITNTFGSAIGIKTATITRSGTADYQGPAPMGSPCNTFGNEPNSGGGTDTENRPTGTVQGPSPFANCSRNPQLWATIQGPGTDKSYGDRYQSYVCASSSTYKCASGTNSEYDPYGYFFVVKVLPGAVGQPIDLQLFDPAYINSGTSRCTSLPPAVGGGLTANMNPYVGADAPTRYSPSSDDASPNMCPSDHVSGSGSAQVTTSYALREQVDSQDPKTAPIISGCVKQFAGRSAAPTASSLQFSNGAYDQQLAQVFHNWYKLCTFTPARSVDYYLEVQSGVKPGGTAVTNTNGKATIIYTGNSKVGSGTTDNTTGVGDNSFAIRAVTVSGLEKLVAVSGYAKMPMFVNADGQSTSFNLIRVLPGAAGQYVSFSFYDIADGSSYGGTVKVSPPSEATWPGNTSAFPGGCSAVGGYAGNTPVNIGTNCSATVSAAKNNAQLETMSIPIPTTYTCNAAAQSGCWYQVTVSFPGSTSVSDITTWDATVVGDPVRLVK
jgi:Flp pilus assembly protein TadG